MWIFCRPLAFPSRPCFGCLSQYFWQGNSGEAWKSFHPVTACGSLLAALVIAVGDSFGENYLKRGFEFNHSVHLFGDFRNPVLQMLRLYGQT